MWIVSEENHSGLFVTEDIIRGITWLVNNDWLLGRNEAEDIFGNAYTLAEQIGTSDKKEIIAWFVVFLANRGIMSTFSLLEDYGIYFSEIEVVYMDLCNLHKSFFCAKLHIDKWRQVCYNRRAAGCRQGPISRSDTLYAIFL